MSHIPKAFAQIVGGLHFIATAEAIKAFKNNTIPKEVSSNGLLVNKKIFYSKSKHSRFESCSIYS